MSRAETLLVVGTDGRIHDLCDRIRDRQGCDLVDRIVDEYPGVAHRAQREHERAEVSGLRYCDALDGTLTDRQREVLETAFHASFFVARGATAEEMATTLDMTPPTFHEHLRRVPAKLASASLETGGDTPTA